MALRVHLTHDPNAKVYVEFGNHPTGQGLIPVMPYPGQVMGATYMQPAPNKTPDSPEEIEPSVCKADYSSLSKDEMNQFFELS